MKKHNKTLQLAAFALASILFMSIHAQAGVILVSGDGNIIPSNEQSNNATFFNNLLGTRKNVAVQNNRLISFWSSNISRYYDNQEGVSSHLIQGTVNSDKLSEVDLLVSVLPDDKYTANEASALKTFLNDGGSLFLIGENSSSIFNIARNSINDLLKQLGSSMSVNAQTTRNNRSVVHADALTTGINSFTFIAPATLTVGDGTTLISNRRGAAIIAYEHIGTPTSVPAPAAFSIVLLGLLLILRGKHKAI